MDRHEFEYNGHRYTVSRTKNGSLVVTEGPETFSHVGAMIHEILRLASIPEKAEMTREQFLAMDPIDQYHAYRVAAGWMATARDWEKAVENAERELQ